MKIEYTKQGDYYLPNLLISNDINNFRLGKYGKLRLHYLKNQRKSEYTILLIENTLSKHLLDIDKTANERYELLMKQLSEKENITEELKATNQMEWVGRMNNIKNQAEEIIFNELIYV